VWVFEDMCAYIATRCVQIGSQSSVGGAHPPLQPRHVPRVDEGGAWARSARDASTATSQSATRNPHEDQTPQEDCWSACGVWSATCGPDEATARFRRRLFWPKTRWHPIRTIGTHTHVLVQTMTAWIQPQLEGLPGRSMRRANDSMRVRRTLPNIYSYCMHRGGLMRRPCVSRRITLSELASSGTSSRNMHWLLVSRPMVITLGI
jgi:hypothetical protein